MQAQGKIAVHTSLDAGVTLQHSCVDHPLQWLMLHLLAVEHTAH